VKTCRLCLAIEAEDTSADGVSSGVNTIALKDIAPLSPGHLLIGTREHSLSLAGTADLQRSEILDRYQRTATQLELRAQPFVAFEHGPAHYGVSGSCIDHCHIHVVPTGRPPTIEDVLSSRVVRREGITDWRELQDLEQIAMFANQVPYVWIRVGSTTLVAALKKNNSVGSQFWRRWYGEIFGISDWNWRDRLRRSVAESLQE